MAKKFVMKPWMIIVASVVVIGAIAGVVVMTLPKKKNDDSVLKSSPPPEMSAEVVEEVKKMEEENKKIEEEEKAVAEQEVQKEIQKVQKTGQKVDVNKIKAKYANQVKRRVQQRQRTHPWVLGGVKCRANMTGTGCVRCGIIGQKDINGNIMNKQGECAECDCSKSLYLDEDNKCRGSDSECPTYTHEYKEVDVNGRKCGRCVEKTETETGKIPTLSAAEKAKIEKDMEMAGKDPFAIKVSSPWFEEGEDPFYDSTILPREKEKFTVTPDCVF